MSAGGGANIAIVWPEYFRYVTLRDFAVAGEVSGAAGPVIASQTPGKHLGTTLAGRRPLPPDRLPLPHIPGFHYATTPCRSFRLRKQHHAFRLSVRSEEHTSELQSLMRISYAVFCLKKKKKTHNNKI